MPRANGQTAKTAAVPATPIDKLGIDLDSDDVKAVKEALEGAFPSPVDDKTIRAPAGSDLDKWLAKHMEHDAARRHHEREQARADNHIRAIIGSYGGVEGETGIASWRFQAGQVDLAAVIEELKVPPPKLEKLKEKHRRKGCRVLRVTPRA